MSRYDKAKVKIIKPCERTKKLEEGCGKIILMTAQNIYRFIFQTDGKRARRLFTVKRVCCI